jgi:hypothetical protein
MAIISIKTNVWAKYTIDYQEKIIEINFDQTKPKISISAIQNTNQGYEAYASKKDTIIIQLEISEPIQQKEGITTQDIEIKVGKETINPPVYRLEKLTGNTQKLIVQGISGNGKLSLNLKKGAITDLAGWENEETNISSGIYIDNLPPKVTYVKENTAEQKEKIAIMQAEEPIRPVEGWEPSNDQKTWKKIVKEEIIFPHIIDYAGNESGQEISIE